MFKRSTMLTETMICKDKVNMKKTLVQCNKIKRDKRVDIINKSSSTSIELTNDNVIIKP